MAELVWTAQADKWLKDIHDYSASWVYFMEP